MAILPVHGHLTFTLDLLLPCHCLQQQEHWLRLVLYWQNLLLKKLENWSLMLLKFYRHEIVTLGCFPNSAVFSDIYVHGERLPIIFCFAKHKPKYLMWPKNSINFLSQNINHPSTKYKTLNLIKPYLSHVFQPVLFSSKIRSGLLLIFQETSFQLIKDAVIIWNYNGMKTVIRNQEKCYYSKLHRFTNSYKQFSACSSCICFILTYC